MTPLLEVLTVRAVHAYEVEDSSALPGLRMLGAVMGLHGIAVNGGLVGGGVENLFSNDRMHAVDDAVEGFRWLGLADVAALVARARDEYQRFRPNGWEDVSAEDASVWDEIDSSFFEIATAERLEAAVSARLQEIAPELPST
ncbi:DMP19 family protein [Kineococcus glutinatus]|uniref:DNA mimic protein DMP19 C-terminal domain-containing protein n=1 Tax=Kineococcus glutinatus TaxID=1070872 RepID=A0ABP9I5F2_9ACTN